MKKAKLEVEEMRAEYRREDLGPLVRGKYAAAYAKATNVVVIDPGLTKVFPNSEAVNPDGHPNSPTFGHLKFPHPEAVRWRVKSGCFTASVGARQDVTFTPLTLEGNRIERLETTSTNYDIDFAGGGHEPPPD